MVSTFADMVWSVLRRSCWGSDLKALGMPCVSRLVSRGVCWFIVSLCEVVSQMLLFVDLSNWCFALGEKEANAFRMLSAKLVASESSCFLCAMCLRICSSWTRKDCREGRSHLHFADSWFNVSFDQSRTKSLAMKYVMDFVESFSKAGSRSVGR